MKTSMTLCVFQLVKRQYNSLLCNVLAMFCTLNKVRESISFHSVDSFLERFAIATRIYFGAGLSCYPLFLRESLTLFLTASKRSDGTIENKVSDINLPVRKRGSHYRPASILWCNYWFWMKFSYYSDRGTDRERCYSSSCNCNSCIIKAPHSVAIFQTQSHSLFLSSDF